MSLRSAIALMKARARRRAKFTLESAVWRAGFDLQLSRLRGDHRSRIERDLSWLKDAEPKTILDIGAHLGDHAVELLRLFPTARLYAFEPLPSIYDRLRARFADDDRVEVRNIALGSEFGEVTFHESSTPESSSLLPMAALHKSAYPRSADTREVTVKVDTLDSLFGEIDLRPPVVVKLDVQGAELAVLQGASSVLSSVQALIIETSFVELYVDQPLFDKIYSFLRGAGFSYAGALNQMNHPLSHRVLQQDAIFVRR